MMRKVIVRDKELDEEFEIVKYTDFHVLVKIYNKKHGYCS